MLEAAGTEGPGGAGPPPAATGGDPPSIHFADGPAAPGRGEILAERAGQAALALIPLLALAGLLGEGGLLGTATAEGTAPGAGAEGAGSHPPPLLRLTGPRVARRDAPLLLRIEARPAPHGASGSPRAEGPAPLVLRLDPGLAAAAEELRAEPRPLWMAAEPGGGRLLAFAVAPPPPALPPPAAAAAAVAVTLRLRYRTAFAIVPVRVELLDQGGAVAAAAGLQQPVLP